MAMMASRGIASAANTMMRVPSAPAAAFRARAPRMLAANNRARLSRRQAVATVTPAASYDFDDRHTHDGDVRRSTYHSNPRNLRTIVDCGSHSSIDAGEGIYTVGHGAVEGPAMVSWFEGAPYFHVHPEGNLTITEEVGRTQDAMERVTGRALSSVDKVLGSVFKGARQSRYLVTLCGDYTLPEGCRALRMPQHECRAVVDLATLPEGQPLVLGPGANLHMTVVMGQVPRCKICPLFLAGSCGNR
jgi:hypothetical protein